MGATSSSTKTRTFQLRNDESLEIPISFDMKFLEMLDQDGKSTTGKAEKRISEPSVESLPEKDLQKRLIWESRSVAQTDLELKELAERMSKNANPDTVPLSAEAKVIKEKLLACYRESPNRILDCPALDQFLALEKSILDQYIKV